MPAPNVTVPHVEFERRYAKHALVLNGLPQVEPRLQKLLAELVMMRLFDEFQEAIAGVALRLACGTPYGDGTPPNLLSTPAKSVTGARDLFATHGRPPARPKLPKWSKVTFINETTKYVLDSADPFSTTCKNNALDISEMQAIRNRIAHSNANSRKAFGTVVKRYYGASLNHVSPGLLLLSPRQSPPLLSRYLTTSRIIVKECARA